MHPLRWLYIDMNSFFASCEQQRHVQLRGKPVGVVPSLVDTTCCIAASYEAKKFGVKTGTLIRDAKQMCPGIQFVVAQHSCYIQFHHKIYQAIDECTPVEKVCSVDEFACRLTGSQQQIEVAKILAQKIKQNIYSKVGESLICSVGISSNRWLAKIAADIQKPNGLTVIEYPQIQSSLFKLKLSDLPGIGRAMEQKLHSKNIKSIEQLYALNQHEMHSLWGGIWGERMYAWLRGHDLELKNGKTQNIGHEHVLEPELRTNGGAYLIAKKLLTKAAYRVRDSHYFTGKLSLRIKPHGFMQESWEAYIKFDDCNDTLKLLQHLAELWKQIPKNLKPLKVSINLSQLKSSKHQQLSLFDTTKNSELSDAMDKINQKLGKNSVYFGANAELIDEEDKNPIAFNHIPKI